jgi:hypothetical protein
MPVGAPFFLFRNPDISVTLSTEDMGQTPNVNGLLADLTRFWSSSNKPGSGLFGYSNLYTICDPDGQGERLTI